MSVETSSKKKKKRNRKKKKNKQNNQSIKRNNIVLEVIEEIEEIEEKQLIQQNQQNQQNILKSSLDKVDYLYNIKNTQTRIIQQLGENNKKNTFLNSKISKIENDIRLLMIFFQNKERDHQREKELQQALRLRELDKIREEHKLIISELKKENENTISELKTALKLQEEKTDKFKNEMKTVLQYLFKMTNDMKEEKENNKNSFKVLDDITKTLTNHVKTISLHIKNLSISNVKNDKIADIITQKVGVINKQMGIVNQRVIRIQEDQELQKITEMYSMMNKNSNSPKNK